MHFSVVVFPAPLGPMRPTTSPPATENDNPDTASREPYVLVSPSTTIIANQYIESAGARTGGRAVAGRAICLGQS